MPDLSAYFARVAALRRDGQPFVLATVVARRAPVSAHLGDRAIVFADGRMEGFVGGACSREIIRTQALEALRLRAARLVSIQPDAGQSASDERVVVSMTCASEGAVDVYVEPIVRPRALVVAGATPVAEALTRLGRAMHYDVVRVVEADERRDVEADAAALGATVASLDALDSVLHAALAHDGECAAVVASQGHYDEPALEAVLKTSVGYVGLVASRKRGATVRAWLAEQHAPGLDRLRNPAGLDLGGHSAEEVALSILAQIVQALSAPAAVAAPPEPAAQKAAVAIDPVCHMDVAIDGAKHTADVAGITYYFCCGGCRTRFVADPDRYLTATT